jgi:hypothetical protein
MQLEQFVADHRATKQRLGGVGNARRERQRDAKRRSCAKRSGLGCERRRGEWVEQRRGGERHDSKQRHGRERCRGRHHGYQ